MHRESPQIPASALLAAVAETAEDAILTIDAGQVIVFVNRGAEVLFGYSRGELIGQPLAILIPQALRQVHEQHVNDFAKSELTSRLMAERKDVSALKKDGSEFLAEASISKVQLPQGGFYTVVMRDITRRHQHEQQVEAALREKDLLLSEVHHRVKNNLQIISSLLSLQADAIGDAKIAGALMDSQSRVRSIALIHQRLYCSQNFGAIDFYQYTCELGQHLLASFHCEERVSLDIVQSALKLSLDQALPCGLILNELMTNALKHAFPGGRQGAIRVVLSSTAPAKDSPGVSAKPRITLEVEDNGVGLPEDFEQSRSSSLGLQLIVSLVGQLQGSVDFLREEKGLKVKIAFGSR